MHTGRKTELASAFFNSDGLMYVATANVVASYGDFSLRSRIFNPLCAFVLFFVQSKNGTILAYLMGVICFNNIEHKSITSNS